MFFAILSLKVGGRVEREQAKVSRVSDGVGISSNSGLDWSKKSKHSRLLTIMKLTSSSTSAWTTTKGVKDNFSLITIASIFFLFFKTEHQPAASSGQDMRSNSKQSMRAAEKCKKHKVGGNYGTKRFTFSWLFFCAHHSDIQKIKILYFFLLCLAISSQSHAMNEEEEEKRKERNENCC